MAGEAIMYKQVANPTLIRINDVAYLVMKLLQMNTQAQEFHNKHQEFHNSYKQVLF